MTQRATILALLLLFGGPVRAADPPTEGEKLFAGKVLPILKAKCLACHGADPKQIKGGLDLTTAKAALAGGDSGAPALVAGKPDVSPLYTAVTRQDPDLVMPPKENDKLSAAEVAALRRWVELGAAWPTGDRLRAAEAAAAREDAGRVRVKTSGGLSSDWTSRTYKPEDLWAYRPVRRSAVPPIANRQSPIANPIDAFILARLDALGLQPALPADRRALVRRATFDLTGLPPTPDEIDAFVNDAAADDKAFETVVDRLLASPHYGERMARHWLDVVRYADSAGFANDYARGSAWRYRDYVVRAFNADTPYDRFITEQLAGDEIDPTNPELLVAVGFLRMGPWELTGMEVPRVARQRFLDDVTDTVGQVFLAHMLQCARCHDHKFDPIPTRDYYRFQAAFATTQPAERAAAFLPAENVRGFDERKYLDARKGRYEALLKELAAKQEAAGKQWAADNGVPYVPRQKGLRTGVPEDKLPPARVGLDTGDLGLERIARKGLERLRWEFDRYDPVATSVYAGRTPQVKSILTPFRTPANPATAGELEVSHILAGGDPFSPTEKVTPGVLSVVGDPALPADIGGRRKALAAWVASPANPLTTRVMVNRVWQWHFGRALAGNPNNFGATGKKPTHPELLDWLAAEFVARKWSVKQMHRLVMLSETYRRAARHPDPKAVAAKDPAGTGYAAFPPRRLTAEELRDAMLAASGELNREAGGIPVRPEIHPDIALQPRQVMGTFAPAWEPSPRPGQRHRRTLYALHLRGLRDPFLEVFNQPGPENPCEAREASTVTPQVFALFNGAAARDRALALAARVLKETKTREAALTRAFRLAFGRRPSAAELAACLTHWAAMTDRHKTLTVEKPKRPREVVREAVEENTGEKFTFTEVLDAAADFVPDLHPADVGPEVRGLMEVCLVLFNANEFAYLD
jgi:mono/diheme cytochrome c family protein